MLGPRVTDPISVVWRLIVCIGVCEFIWRYIRIQWQRLFSLGGLWLRVQGLLRSTCKDFLRNIGRICIANHHGEGRKKGCSMSYVHKRAWGYCRGCPVYSIALSQNCWY